ncbi:MAG: glucokinase [Gammaproteobacteria bacterium]|jgi:glucokinase
MRVLAGDIGGTKTILRLADYQDGSFSVLVEERYESRSYEQFDAVLQAFFDTCGDKARSIDAACVGVAGPIDQHTARVTNLPWQLDSTALADSFAIDRFSLINDFQAIGYGIEQLGAQDLVTLQEGNSVAQATRAVIGAGTGVGHAMLTWCNDAYQVLPCEAGHAGFAPANEEQTELLRFLLRKFDIMSVERVLSGPGIKNIFDFVADQMPNQLSAALKNDLTGDDPTPVIVDYALQQKDPVAQKSLDIFVDIYGSAAGNLALTTLATGGVYIAGGVAPRIVDKLQDGAFIEAFNNKSKMKDLLTAMPVKVITNPKVGLIGAAVYAARDSQ